MAAILKIVFGHYSAANCPISVKFCARKQFFYTEFRFGNGTDIGVSHNVFFVLFSLYTAAPFISSPIHLFVFVLAFSYGF